MGREVRMVPPNWEHPTKENLTHRGIQKIKQPMFDQNYKKASQDWRDGFTKWEAGGREAERADSGEDYEYWDWEGMPPNKEYYRPWRDEEATWFQLWETVSEGTPVSPPFATREELAAYLAEHGDEWDQSRGHGGWGIKRAQAFVAAGWAPSFAIMNGKMIDGTDIPLAMASEGK